jgi:GH43 family beta-xylosidase
MRRLLLLLAALAVLASPAAASAGGSFRNPVVPATTAGDDTPDPWIFRHDGRYRLTYTSTDHIELRSARTLAGLATARPQRLWPPAGRTEPADRCCSLWAPEIHRLQGPDGPRWYVYYAATERDGGGHRMYVLESARDDPAGPYRFKAQLHLPQPFAIDGTVAAVGGRLLLIYSGGPSPITTSLFVVALADPWTVAGEPVEISRPTLPWERISFPINEGPELLVRGGRLHVTYSASWCGTGAYALGRLTVPRGADLLDPATWRAAKSPAPVFAAAPSSGVFGPGHGSFFRSPDGREEWMVYHATDDDRGCFTGGLRTTRAQPFRWSEDGTPHFGAPVALDADLAAPGGDGTVAVQVEDALGGAARARARVVSDRRMVGYRGVVVRLGALPPLRVLLPRAGRYALHLRLLDAGRVVERSLGTASLPAGAATLRLRVPARGAAATLDQLRLERVSARR